MTDAQQQESAADRVVLRYAPATDRVRDELSTSRYAAYLRRAEGGSVEPGAEWDHFVSCGCGTTRDVVLRVELVEGGERVGEDTAFEFVPARESDGETASTLE